MDVYIVQDEMGDVIGVFNSNGAASIYVNDSGFSGSYSIISEWVDLP